MKKNNQELKFSVLKVKKIIQENKEIGKIANMTPFVICINIINNIIAKSLEYFIKDVLIECSNLVKNNGGNKVTPAHM